MNRRLRNIMLVVLPIALATCIASATAAAATLPGCNNPADSALNQYCDSVPAPGGAQLPAPGAASLASSLPPQIVRRIDAAGGPGGTGTRSRASAHRRLLSLPAPPTRDAVPGSSAAATVTSVWSLSSWMIAVLIGAALLLAAIAIARGRRQRPGAS